jgi:hypothetical protein
MFIDGLEPNTVYVLRLVAVAGRAAFAGDTSAPVKTRSGVSSCTFFCLFLCLFDYLIV